jgi:hypothetical protein
MMNVAKPLDRITLTEFETMEKEKTVTVHDFATIPLKHTASAIRLILWHNLICIFLLQNF